MLYLHLPCALWGALVELMGFICPLTPLELKLRRAAGLQGYEGGFIENYVMPVVYPEALTRAVQIGLGVALLALNAVVYWMLRKQRRLFRADARL